MRFVFSFFSCFLLLTTACSISHNPPENPHFIDSKSIRPRLRSPIAQIKQSLNLSARDNAYYVREILKNNKINIENEDDENGTFESDWIFLSDSVCGGYKMLEAPLNCRTKLFFKISSINEKASAVHIKHKEICNLNEDVTLNCPNSKAEQIMFAITEELKELDYKTNKRSLFDFYK